MVTTKKQAIHTEQRTTERGLQKANKNIMEGEGVKAVLNPNEKTGAS